MSAPGSQSPVAPDERPGLGESGNDPLVLLELIQRLKVRDVMTADLVTLPRDASMRQAQELMRQKKISGVPVEEKGRFFGLVSIDDIIRALVAGTIHESCGRHMTTKLVVLEDDMPLSFALRYFDRYHYGRFPVLNRDRRLVGIICQRDINRALLVELTRELQRLESVSVQRGGEGAAGSLYLLREFPICKYDFENAGKAANQIKQVLQEKKFATKVIRRIAVAAYELEINLCVHSDGGVLSWQVSSGRAEVIARDAGPGIEDVEWACRDGTSTANEWIRSLGFGAGMGLVNVRRVSDEFEITSKKGSGTTVKAVIYIEGGAA
ncbi:MAG: CBS domain-containing protein [Kiritimatiellia bacterium]|jgi:CBS domain-containing protein/anti-sigma regulatory factor (Ser/Thr protein kinase)|nr:CBS domain-containing protein [Kiritimatiellia bacterium]MDD4174037.1 CBS domain-containing protein [Kiritimatiellia bacterium]MDD4442008.1 CBS domain-containing protein [Kiritimatiellia bacterium]NLC83397.1 CBS domain-containing protein [Lentisphaerota bacterium]